MSSEERFEKFHFEFFQGDDCVNVYEMRDGDVIGGFYDPPYTIEEIKEAVKDMDEEDVYDFVHGNIEYY